MGCSWSLILIVIMTMIMTMLIRLTMIPIIPAPLEPVVLVLAEVLVPVAAVVQLERVPHRVHLPLLGVLEMDLKINQK